MLSRALVFVVVALALIVVGGSAQAQAPRKMSFQGLLTDDLSVPIDGLEDITIKIFTNSTAGTQKWTRTYTDVPVEDGVFNLVLEYGSPLFETVAFEDSLWIEVQVDAEVISPRTKLTAAPYAMGLSLPISAITDASYALDIESTASSGGAVGVRGTTNSTGGDGVAGLSNAATGNTSGVYGRSNSTEGNGVYGSATAATGYVNGVFGRTNSPDGNGVEGYNQAATGDAVGVYGWSVNSTTGRGVYGWASADAGATNGVRGYVNSGQGFGGYFWGGKGTYTRGGNNDAPDLILGGSSTDNDDGRIFSDISYANSDIWLHSNDAVVIVLDNNADAEDADFEVRDYNNNIRFNVDEDGTVSVPGTLTKGSGTFKIDHPLDPQRQYLYHSFVESPDMKNVYDGTVLLDESGSATIQLPSYFEALNRDFRYQLTAVGEAAPELHVSRRVEGNRFSIAGGKPGMEVSWQVTGVRKDPFAEVNRIQVEVDKPVDEIGTYLHPEAYRLVAEKGGDVQAR